MVREIPLTQGKVALVDDEDYELVSQYKWRANKNFNTYYANRNVKTVSGENTTQSMHKLITGYKQTDHKNGNGLDNRRENLREVTNFQNQWNQSKQVWRKTSSKYKGVSFAKDRNKWYAYIKIKGKQLHIGRYNDEILAATAYDSYARHFYGEFGTYNFPEEGERSAI